MSSSLFTPILVSGADTRTFLQGQLTCDIETLKRDAPLLACINSPQGRVQAVLNAVERDEGIVLLVVNEMTEQTIQRLRKYVLRSKVKIERADATLASTQSPASSSLLLQLRAGIPHVFPETHEAFVAQMLNLDALGAISFSKGCYTGQEIIARAHYRGAVKRRMFRFAANCPPPQPGARVVAVGAEHAGDVVYAAATESGCELLAVVNLAHVESNLTLDQTQTALTALPLPYSTTS